MTVMVLNLKIENCFALNPLRRCRKKTGPGESILIAIALKSIKGARMIKPSEAPMMSTRRFDSISTRDSGPR